jgi:GNAT superfamily N-acetyltransferase
MGFEIRPEDADSEDVRDLVADLDELLDTLYSLEGGVLELPSGDLAGGRGTLLVARDDSGRAVGCGAVRRIGPLTGELKRMYVRPVARRLGVGRAILASLESWAAGAGLELLVLETGIHQPVAMAFYERAGYVRIDRYGEHPCSDQSVCYGKPVDKELPPDPPPARTMRLELDPGSVIAPSR